MSCSLGATFRCLLPSFFPTYKVSFSSLLQTLARNDRKYVEASNGVEGKPIEPRVQKIAFNADGSVMATISLKSLPCAHDGVQGRLSFWDRTASGSEPYEVNTSIDDPHRYAACLLFGEQRGKKCAAFLVHYGDFIQIARVWVAISMQFQPCIQLF